VCSSDLALYAYNQDYDLALTEINKAVDIAPNSSLFAINKGVILEQLKDYEEGRTTYKFVLGMNPGWATNYFWRENDFRLSILTSFVTPDESPILSFEEAINQSYGIPMVKTAQVEMANGNLENTESLARLAGLTYFSYPAQRMELDWLKAELAYRQNDLDTAVDISAKLLDQLESPGIFGPGSAGASQYYDGVYRHPVLPVELVPQLTIIHLPGEWEQRVDLHLHIPHTEIRVAFLPESVEQVPQIFRCQSLHARPNHRFVNPNNRSLVNEQWVLVSSWVEADPTQIIHYR